MNTVKMDEETHKGMESFALEGLFKLHSTESLNPISYIQLDINHRPLHQIPSTYLLEEQHAIH